MKRSAENSNDQESYKNIKTSNDEVVNIKIVSEYVCDDITEDDITSNRIDIIKNKLSAGANINARINNVNHILNLYIYNLYKKMLRQIYTVVIVFIILYIILYICIVSINII